MKRSGRMSGTMALLLAAALAVPCLAGESRDLLRQANQEKNAGRLEQAENLYRDLLDDPEVDEAARSNLARVLSWQGKFDEAVEQYGELRRLYPARAFEADIGMARSYAWGGEFREAVEVATTALSENPDNPELLLLLGQVESWAGHTDRSVEAFDRLLELEPGNRRALIGRTRAISWSGGFVEAEQEYRRILEHHPDFVEARVALVHNMIWMGRSGDAVAVLDGVADEDRHRLDVSLARVALERSRGNRAEYRRQLGALREKYPGNTDVMRFTRLEVGEVGPAVRTQVSWVKDSDELETWQYMVGASVPVSPSAFLFLEGRASDLSDAGGLHDTGDGGAATVGIDWTAMEGVVVRVWGGSRLASDADNGFVGGARATWRPLRNISVSGGCTRSYADYTPESIRNNVRESTVHASLFMPLAPRVTLTGLVSRRNYRGVTDGPFEQTRDLLDASVKLRLRGRGKLRPAVGLRGQFFRFSDPEEGVGYFNPKEFRRLLAFATLTRRHRERMRIVLDVAYGIKNVVAATGFEPLVTEDKGWEEAGMASFVLALPIRKQIDLTARASYSRLSITTGNYSSYAGSIGLLFRLK